MPTACLLIFYVNFPSKWLMLSTFCFFENARKLWNLNKFNLRNFLERKRKMSKDSRLSGEKRWSRMIFKEGRKMFYNCFGKQKSEIDVAALRMDFSNALEWKCDETRRTSVEIFCSDFRFFRRHKRCLNGSLKSLLFLFQFAVLWPREPQLFECGSTREGSGNGDLETAIVTGQMQNMETR